MRNTHSSRLLPAIGLLAACLWAGCGGVDRGPSGLTPTTDGGARDLAGGGSCAGCNAQCCASRCVDIKTDVANCGSCGIKCKAGEICFGGLCQCGGMNGQGAKVCTRDEACCGGKCVNVQNDATNCGTCGKDCTASGEACFAGACGCGSGNAHCGASETCCGASCSDIQTDATNCGACGTKCPGTCTGGMCDMVGQPCGMTVCKQGEMCFNNVACVPVGGGGGGGMCMSDADCAKGSVCFFGFCLPLGGGGCVPACAPGKICLGNVCI